MERRRPLQARLTPEASEAIDRFLATHNITATSFVEAIGLAIGEGRARLELATVASVARAIDLERKSRR